MYFKRCCCCGAEKMELRAAQSEIKALKAADASKDRALEVVGK